MADYDAYFADPKGYDYEKRRKERHISKEWMGQEGYSIPMTVTEEFIKQALEDESEER